MSIDINRKAPRRIAQAIISSLKGGVVPRVGLPYITVGREKEIEAFLNDEEIIAEGGASFRFIVGKYGSGKSFLLQTIRNYALDKNFVVVDADENRYFKYAEINLFRLFNNKQKLLSDYDNNGLFISYPFFEDEYKYDIEAVLLSDDDNWVGINQILSNK